MNLTLIGPVILFVLTSFILYNNSKDPEKKQTPMKFVFPGVIVGVLSFIALKYKDNMTPEPMMQGSYFD